MVADVKRLGENAKMLGSVVKDGKPASAHVTTLVDQVKKVQGAIAASSAANTACRRACRCSPSAGSWAPSWR